MRKFNIGTELRQAFGASLAASLAKSPKSFDRIELLKPTIAAVRAAAAEVIRNLVPANSRPSPWAAAWPAPPARR